jgi:hypothetical protein
MANALYTKGKEALLGSVDLTVDTIKAALVSSAHTANLATDQFFSTVSGSVLGTPQTLAGKSITDGVFNASSSTFTAVAGGATVKYVVYYKDTGNAATSPLLLCVDTLTGVTLPMSTNGGDITIAPDAGANKLFRLS